jgi:hypothetical protein
MTEENRTEQDASDETQVTEESVVTPSNEPETGALRFAFGDAASTQFPSQVGAALEFAGENKYEYGPRLRNAELDWNVVSAEPMANNIVRVRLEFAPASGFRGNPGSEYLDVDAAGAILARRQISIPKENSPVVLMGITAVSIVIAVVFISMMTVFKSEGGDPLYVAGRTLWIRAEVPKSQEYITYSGADQTGTLYNWAMKPDDEASNELVYVKVTLINEKSGSVNVVVDEGAAVLMDGNKKTYEPINAISRAELDETEESDPKYNVENFIPMWGTVQIKAGEQVIGMMVFELPRGSSFSEFRWKASDSATISYQ